MKRVAIALLVVLAGVASVGVAPTAADGTSGTASVGTASTAVSCEFPVTVEDASGTEVTVAEEPERVVALQPSAAQTLWEIGAQDKVVGAPVGPYTDYLEGIEEKTSVAGVSLTVQQSKVVNLSADLVLAPNITKNATIESLRNAGQKVYHFRKAKSLDDVYAKTELTGRLVGEFEGAANRTAEMKATVNAIEDAVADEEEPAVFYSLGGSYTAGTQTFIHELITAAGAKNVAAEAGISDYKPISQETILEQNPEWVVIPEGRSLPKNDAFNSTTAVQENQIVRVNADYLNQAGPRNTIPLQKMAEAFHPSVDVAGAVESAEAVSPTQCASAVDNGTATNDTTSPLEGNDATATPSGTETPGETGPGFTAGLAAVALALVALLARRE